MKTERAFTLIELSIVLVIIGLIVGGVLVGRDLIQASEMRMIIRQQEQFKTAITTFQGKYNCVPGDCATATTFFPADSGGCVSGIVSAGNGTCNGNGDGIVLSTASSWAEAVVFWQQLSLAGLVAGKFSGAYLAGPDYINWTPGIQGPAGPRSNSVWTSKPVSYSQSIYASAIDTYNVIALTGANSTYSRGVLNAKEVQSIDIKMDDSLAYSGWLVALNTTLSDTNGCVDAAWHLSTIANYLPASTRECRAVFFYTK